jgi:putative nucleotidyltransferase with HDIG domain
LEIVARIALELADKYPEADRDLVEVMAWLHDYGKIIDFNNEYETTQTEGPKILAQLGFPEDFAQKAVEYIGILDKKLEIDLHGAPVEVQIVSSADGCSHMVGPFMYVFWHHETDKTFADQTYEQHMAGNIEKVNKDWNHKIVLPEARAAFDSRYRHILETSGQLPDKFLG